MNYLTLLLSLILLSACTGSGSESIQADSSPVQVDQIYNKTWVLESWSYSDGGHQPTSDLAFTIQLSNSSTVVAGRRDCSDYSGIYQILDNSIFLSADAHEDRCGFRSALIRVQKIQIEKLFNRDLEIELKDNRLVFTSEDNEKWVFADRPFPSGPRLSPNGTILSPEVADISEVFGQAVVPLDDSFSCVLAGVCTEPLVQDSDAGSYARPNPESYAWKSTSTVVAIHQVRYIANSQDTMQSIISTKRATRTEMVDSFAENYEFGSTGSVFGARLNSVQYLFIRGEPLEEYPDCDPTRIAGEEWNTYYVVDIEDMDGTVATYIQDPSDFETWHEGVCGFGGDQSPWVGVLPAGTIHNRLRSLYHSF